jgi:hypothetical protein
LESKVCADTIRLSRIDMRPPCSIGLHRVDQAALAQGGGQTDQPDQQAADRQGQQCGEADLQAGAEPGVVAQAEQPALQAMRQRRLQPGGQSSADPDQQRQCDEAGFTRAEASA